MHRRGPCSRTPFILAAAPRDDSFLTTNLVIYFLVNLDAKILQVLARILAEVGLVLTIILIRDY